MVRSVGESLYWARLRLLRHKKKPLCTLERQDLAPAPRPAPAPPLPAAPPSPAPSHYSSARASLHSSYMAVPGSEARVPLTFSWPSLEAGTEAAQGEVSVHNPSTDTEATETQDTVQEGGPGGGARARAGQMVSSGCDSGYSELDLCCSGPSLATQPPEPRPASYLEELRLYRNLETIFDTAASHEDSCYHELELSDTESRDCSCSDYSCSLPATARAVPHSSVESCVSGGGGGGGEHTHPAVISLAQLLSSSTSARTAAALHQHNVSKKYLASLHSKQHTAAASTGAGPRVARGDSSSSLPVSRKSSGQEQEVRDQARRRSLPRVTRLGGDVMLVEQSKQSREIFI